MDDEADRQASRGCAVLKLQVKPVRLDRMRNVVPFFILHLACDVTKHAISCLHVRRFVSDQLPQPHAYILEARY